jgi:methylated-DNA-protein-cysteine methyltransferase-like protein
MFLLLNMLKSWKQGITEIMMREFFSGVYKIVAQIPEGYVATYGQIAALLGNPLAARAVGDAMRRVPEYMDIPCHRVVNKTGAMAPGHAFGGVGRQRDMLEREGVIFKENGCIDMKRCNYFKLFAKNIDSL